MQVRFFFAAPILASALLAGGCASLQEGIDATAAEVRALEANEETSSSPSSSPATSDAPALQPTTSATSSDPGTTQEEQRQVTSPVRVTMDGAEDKAGDPYGIYWDVQRPAGAEPHFVLSIDPALGEFQRLIINLYEADADGKETGQPWAITDFGGEQLLLPNRSINLAKPGAVTILSPAGERIQAIPVESGKRYIALFVVTGSKGAHTHKVRFSIR